MITSKIKLPSSLAKPYAPIFSAFVMEQFHKRKLATRAFLLWVSFLILAFVNGAFRELVLIPRLGMLAQAANQLSCVTGVAVLTAVCAIFWRRLAFTKLSEAVSIGVAWFFATMLFETFVINRKLSWSQILQTYDVSAGEYWGLVLLWVGILPIVAYLFFGVKERPEHHQ